MRTTTLIAGLAAVLITATAALADTAPPSPPPPPGITSATELERFAFQGGLGYLNGGDVAVEDDEVETDGGPLVSLAVDSIVSPRMSLGLFAIATSLDAGDSTARITTLGGTIKARFGAPTGTQVRVGVALGYQRITIEDADIEAIQGFDIAPIVEVAFPTSKSMRVVLQASALSQPAGGNSDVEVTFAPMGYLAALVEIH
jgi:hypothetical protein